MVCENLSHNPRTHTHDPHCARSVLYSIVLRTSIHLERRLNETGQSRSQLAWSVQWAKIARLKYAGKCANFQLASTHVLSVLCSMLCGFVLKNYLKLSTANRIATLSLSLCVLPREVQRTVCGTRRTNLDRRTSLLPKPPKRVYFKTDHKLEGKK